MRINLYKISTAILAIAITFIFSCSGDGGGGGGDNSSSSSDAAISSSSGGGLSSSGGSSSSVPVDSGSDDSSSSSDGDVSSSSHIPVWGEWSVTTAPTCEAAGVETRTNDISQTETRPIEQLSWSLWSVTTAATCEADGVETRTCPGNASPAQTQPINQLAWSDWIITTPAAPGSHATGYRTCPNEERDEKDDLTICGEDEYSPAEQFCRDDEVLPLCGTAHYTANQFCDTRDNKLYKFVTIGTGETAQIWMAENLNYKTSDGNSRCYPTSGSTQSSDADEGRCATYGRLYNWATAMNIDASCNSKTVVNCGATVSATNHQGVCPGGWHLPSNAEWDALMTAVGGSSTAGTKLKAISGWNSGDNGEDTYGFSALPGGSGGSGGNFNYVGDNGYWWSSSEIGANDAYNRGMDYNYEYAYWSGNNKSFLYSVRCVKD